MAITVKILKIPTQVVLVQWSMPGEVFVSRTFGVRKIGMHVEFNNSFAYEYV
jgi:hypothetical protein